MIHNGPSISVQSGICEPLLGLDYVLIMVYPSKYIDYSMETQTIMTLVLSTVYEQRERPAAWAESCCCARVVRFFAL